MYYLKYYAEIQNFRGQFSRVEIHQAGTRPGEVLIIGDVCGLDLEIQGSQDDVFTPIVKTQAHLSMISSDDKPTAGGVKYGGWGEFFTPDATLYKMLIKTRATEQDSWTTRWTGYITPDSWQEDLGYRTPVTITARDNIGHLQDFEFDFDNYDQYGLASIRSIITAGMNLIELPMTLDMNSAPANFQAAGTDVLDSMVSCRHFEGKDWYSVIESLLDAIGYTLRYTDNNRVTLAPIRYLPNGGRGTGGDNRSNAVPVQFYDGNGVVVPAVKSIIEEHNYDYLGEVEIPIRSSDINYGTEGSYKAYVKWTNTRPGMAGIDSPVYSIVDGGSTNWLPGSDLYKTEDPSLLTLDREGESWDDYIFLAANGKRYSDAEGKRKQALQFTTRTPNVTLRAKFNSNPLSDLQDIYVPEDPEYEEEIKGGFVLENIGLYTFEFKVKYESNGETIYWDDTAGWVTEEVTNTRTFDPSSMTTDVEIQLESAFGMEGHGVMTFYFENIQYETSGMSSLIVACHGVYARLSSFTIEPNAINLSKNTVKTNSDERYNVILRRNPEVSPLSRDVLFALPGNYETGLFYYPSGSNFPEQYPYSGNWSNLNTSATKPLPVIIHQQILAFRGGVLWELSGECAPIDGGILFANQLVRYKDRVYLITSGTIDFYGSGNLLSAVLREYVDYDDIWDDTEQGDWSGDGEYNTIGGETASGSGHSGSSGGGGGSATNFFELDGEGGVKLKDRYNGLWANGFMTAGGAGATSGGEGGADLQSVWLSLKTNEDDFANEKIHPGHLPPLSWSMITSGKPDTLAGYGILNAYTKTEVDNLIGAIDQFHYEIYPSLASITSPASNVLYLIGPTGTGSDKYEEYVYANGTFTKIGDTTIDLSPYLTIASAQATYQPIISDLATIRSRSDEGHTAYGWGDHSQVGYLLATTAAQTYQTIIGDLSTIRSRADEGHTAYGWGNHANAGYFAASSFTAANIVSTLGTTAVNRATADESGNNIINTYATITALNGVSGRVTTLEARTNWDNYFGIDANGDVYVKMKDANNARNFYGYGAVTAGGVGSSSGGGGGEGASLLAVWRSLTNNNSLVDADITSTLKIATEHIPDLSISKVTGLQTALDGKQATISDLSTIRSNASLGASAYNALPNYLPLSGGTMAGNLDFGQNRYLQFNRAAGDGGILFMNNGTYKWQVVNDIGNNALDFYNYALDANVLRLNSDLVTIKNSGSGGVVLEIKRTSGEPYVKFSNNSSTFGYIGASSGGGFLFKNSSSDEVFSIQNNGITTISGLSNSDGIPFVIKSSSSNQVGIDMKIGGNYKSRFSYIASYGGTVMYDYTTGAYINIEGTNGDLYWKNTYKYLHSGNYSSYALPLSGGTMSNTNLVTNLNADLLDGQHGSYYATASSLGNYLPLAGGTMSGAIRGIGYMTSSNGDSGMWRGSMWTGSLGDDDIAIAAYNNGGKIWMWASEFRFFSSVSLTRQNGNNLYTVWDSSNSDTFSADWYAANLKLAETGEIFWRYGSGYDTTEGAKIYRGSGSYTDQSLGDLNFSAGTWTSSADVTAFRFSTKNVASALCIKNNGYVGIGTYTPGHLLDVNGNIGFNASLFASNGKEIYCTGTYLAINSDSNTRTATFDGQDCLFGYGSGKVGIGTTSPSYKLQVNGTVWFDGAGASNYLILNRTVGTDGGILLRDSTNGFNFQINASDSRVLDFYCYAASKTSFRLGADGNTYVYGGLSVYDATTLSGALTVNNTASISGNTTIGGTLTVTGSAYLDSTVRIGGSSGATLTYESAYGGLKSDKGIYSLNYMTAGGVNASSDQRLKSNISRVSGADAIAVIMALKPSEWVWNEKHYQNGKKGAGLIAQDVQGVLPFAVSHETEYLSLNYNVFHAFEMAGLQDHETRIKKLEREGREKDMKIASLSTECRELRRQIAQLTS